MNSPGPSSGEWNLLEKLLPNVPRGTREAILRYIDLVFAWNTKVNLTGAKSRQVFIEEHLLDSLAAWQVLSEKTAFIDVGTGAGLPGVVWALLDPSILMVLLDASLKRTAFLQRLRSELELKNTQVLARRFEDLSDEDLPASVPTWDLVSRGTATPRDLLQLAHRSQIPWRRWYVFSNEKIHAEYLTQAPPLGVEVLKISYRRFLRQDEAGRPGILTLLQRTN
ncbi:MAG: 16S rRNA (guanine(527)-N(7))-methyltransferase RsmG [Deltaproteobacteria bacterium]|nr:16S rRNA (guanine(527)-N(7))-methyltransferase RsmG [Deltaproteobacteria bacterium]